MDTSSRFDPEPLLAEREWLHRLARRLLGDGPDADDLSQETLARAIETGGPRARSRGWLATVARNLSFEHRRAAAHRRSRERAGARLEAVDDDEALERAEMQRALLDEVLALPEPMRTVVVLRYLEGLSYEEIAARHATPIATVRKQASRGIERLRARLDERRGGRGAWAGILAPLAGWPTVAPPVATTAATLRGLIEGALVMSTKSKLVAAVVTVVLALVVAITQLERSPSASELPEPEAVGALEAPRAGVEEVERDENSREPVTVELARDDEERPSVHYAFPPHPESTVGTLELRVRWSDGTAAEGVNAQVMPWGAEDSLLHQRSACTNRDGVAVLDQLAPGRTGVYLDRGGFDQANVIAGAVTLLEVQIPTGITVRGRVLDPEGNPIGGATLSLSSYGNPTEGFPVGTADEEGRFEVRDVSDGHYLSARSEGFAPSDQLYVTAGPGAEIEVDLVLRGKGGAIEGIVLSPDGHPLVGARVLLTGRVPAGWKGSRDWIKPGVERRRVEEPLPFALRTDEAGRFFTDQVGAGSIRVQARAEEWMPWVRSVEIAAGETTQVEIRLVEGATLEGIVHRADGSPAEEAKVLSGRYGEFESYNASCGADGRYQIRGLPSGSVDVRATESGRGTASATLSLVESVVNRWDVSLAEGAAARGVVVDERGEPLERWYVGVSDDHGHWSRGKYTDAAGRFEVTDIKEGWTDLAIAPPDWIETGPSVVLRDVLPTEEELRIEVPDAVRPNAKVSLRLLVDGEPAPRDSGVVVSSRAPFSQHVCYPDETGAVEVARLIPGDYTLTIRVPDRATRRFDLHLTADEVLDLGVLDITVGGHVRLVLEGDAVAGYQQARVVDAEGKEIDFFDVREGQGVSSLLPPGPVRLRIASSKVATQVIEGAILDGETIELHATPRPGTVRRVMMRTGTGAPVPSFRTQSVYDAEGNLVQCSETNFSSTTPKAEARTWVQGLELGWYRVVVETPNGLRGETELTVTTLDFVEEDVAEIVLE